MELILASGSPRRRELLARITPDFKVVISDVDETIDETLPGTEIVAELAKRKAQVVAQDYPTDLVIGSDTIVYLDGRVLGKPADEAEAKQMLEALSGTTHHVYTAVYLTNGITEETQISDTKVTLHPLTAKEIADYVDSGEPMDKAGAYGIQGLGALLVDEIQGDFYGVAGFPIATVYRMLKKVGFIK
ncbi:Maf family protein [Carnobacterium gallinarum]|uniref:Maf family protein n=1 Tax=Carnobacterium gallinarum TaxID=2749 RepID=UPI0005545211|nr:Maf family protein [Carnobacterium gallinarum]